VTAAHTFTGFGERLVDFYEGLAADNSKPYWNDHRAIYEEQVKAPMLALLADLEPEFGSPSMFRPYRDVRFSKDKSPYKTACGATVGEYYLQVSADGLMAAGGYYQMTSDQVQRFRAAVDDERRGEDLRARLAELEAAGLTAAGERLKSRPRGFDPDHPRIELLRHNSLYAWRGWPPDDALHTPTARDRVCKVWRTLGPLSEWLNAHVGPAEPAQR
jgi:uncharacterized protein (TIGR02453 family)